MFIRKMPRGMTFVALAACAPLVIGCATTQQFVVDPDVASSLAVEAVRVSGQTKNLDAAGGRVDPLLPAIIGTTEYGEPLVALLTTVDWFRYRREKDTLVSIEANPAALVDGADWRPDGSVRHLLLRTGEFVDLSLVPTTVDAEGRVVKSMPAWGEARDYTFGEIEYVQIRDGHLGRTVLLILGIACVGIGVAGALAFDSWEFSPE